MKKTVFAVALASLPWACGSRSIPEDEGTLAACPVCANASFTCRSADPKQESVTMVVSAGGTDSCVGDLGHANLEVRCKQNQVCEDGNCVPLSYDGTTLVFTYGAGRVSCVAQR